jgi:hypothetical protein
MFVLIINFTSISKYIGTNDFWIFILTSYLATVSGRAIYWLTFGSYDGLKNVSLSLLSRLFEKASLPV